MHGSVREIRERERLTTTRGKGKERGDGVDQRARVLERKEAENGEGRKEKKEWRKFGDRVKEEEEIEVNRGFEDEKWVNFIDFKVKEEVIDELFDNVRSRRGTASTSNVSLFYRSFSIYNACFWCCRWFVVQIYGFAHIQTCVAETLG